MFTTICLALSIILYSTYISIIYYKYKPSCLSESYYLIKNQNLFSYWIVIVSFLIFPAWVEISPINYQFLPFLSVVTLSSVGIHPKYLENQKKVHIISASLSAIISITWNIVTGQYIVPLVLCIVLLILVMLQIKNLLFWAENTAFANIYLSILFT